MRRSCAGILLGLLGTWACQGTKTSPPPVVPPTGAAETTDRPSSSIGMQDPLKSGVFVRVETEIEEFCATLAAQLPEDALVGVLPFAHLPGKGSEPTAKSPEFGVKLAKFVGERLQAAAGDSVEVLATSELATKLVDPADNMPQTFRMSTTVDCRGRLACMDVVMYGECREVELSAGVYAVDIKLTAFDVFRLKDLGGLDGLRVPRNKVVRDALTTQSDWKVVKTLAVSPPEDWGTEMSLHRRQTSREVRRWLGATTGDELKVLVLPLDLRDIDPNFESLFAGMEAFSGAIEGSTLELDGASLSYVEAKARLDEEVQTVQDGNAHRFAQDFGRKVAGVLASKLTPADVRSDQGDDTSLARSALWALGTREWESYARGFGGDLRWKPEVVVMPRVRRVAAGGYELLAELHAQGQRTEVVSLGDFNTESMNIHGSYTPVVTQALQDGFVASDR